MAAKKTPANKKAKTTKAKSAPAPAPVEEPTPAPAPVEEPAPAPVEEPTLMTYDFKGLQDKLKATLQMVRELTTEVNRMEKEVNRERRSIEKRLRTRPRRVGKNTLNGFSKPGRVSAELRKFLGIGKDDLIARTDVTKGITKYCQEHSLHKPEDKRVILPDTKLRKLLRVDKGQELTYFNLQTYMKVHFPNKEGVFPEGITA
jgi:chromatin remodeling complex protein RSC6